MTDEAIPTRITIHDVARIAGVSIATVSKALNEKGRLSESTREKVRAVAEEMNFRPNAMARGLHSRRSYSVGLLTDDSYGRFSLPVMTGVTEGLIGKGLSVFLCGIDGPPELGRIHLNTLLDKQVDGLLISGRRVDKTPDIDLSGLNLPIVYALSEGPSDAVTVTPDEKHGAGLAVSHLIEIGRRRIAHVTGPKTFRVARERAEAWQQTLAREGLWPAGGDALHGTWSEAWGHEATAQLFDGRAAEDRPDAIFCGNDLIGRGVIDAMRDRALSVPDDVAVVGFDNWEVLANQARPPLSSVDFNLKALGHEAGMLLTRMIDGEEVPPGLIRLPCTLIARGSSLARAIHSNDGLMGGQKP